MKTKGRYDSASKSEKKRRKKSPQTDVDPMSRNFKSLAKLNNTAAGEKKEIDRNNLLRNVFIDYTAGWNLSEYRDILINPKIGNGTVQWIVNLRERFRNYQNGSPERQGSMSSNHTKHYGFGKPPAWYFAGNNKNILIILIISKMIW